MTLLRWSLTLFVMAIATGTSANSNPRIILYPGFVTKVYCQGRLILSAVGDERLVRREAVPKELGCAVFLALRGGAGKTNLFIETTGGSYMRIIEVAPPRSDLGPKELEVHLPPMRGER